MSLILINWGFIMGYRNNWPTYVQEKKKPSKGITETVVSTANICVGVKPTHELEEVFAVISAKEDEVIKKKMAYRQLPIDQLLNQLISFQRSKDRAFSCQAKKASIELALERKRLSNMKEKLLYEVRRGRMTRETVESKMRVENRKALSFFLARWANIFEV